MIGYSVRNIAHLIIKICRHVNPVQTLTRKQIEVTTHLSQTTETSVVLKYSFGRIH